MLVNQRVTVLPQSSTIQVTKTCDATGHGRRASCVTDDAKERPTMTCHAARGHAGWDSAICLIHLRFFRKIIEVIGKPWVDFHC
jgi:hypothetical protein